MTSMFLPKFDLQSFPVNIIHQVRCFISLIATHLAADIPASSPCILASIHLFKTLATWSSDRMDRGFILSLDWPIAFIAGGITGLVIGGIWLVIWQCLKTRELNRDFEDRKNSTQPRHVHFDERLVLD